MVRMAFQEYMPEPRLLKCFKCVVKIFGRQRAAL